MVRSDIFFVVCQRWALNGCLFDKWECCEEKIFVGENTSDWAKGGCNERKAYLFVCYLGRGWIDCWKLKTRSWWRDAESLEVSGSSRWPKQTGSPVCHLSACSSPALLGSFNPLPPHLARHITNPLRGLFTWCRGGFPLAFSLASWREKKLMVQRSTRTRLAWLCLDEKELGFHLGIASVIWLEIVCPFTCYSPNPQTLAASAYLKRSMSLFKFSQHIKGPMIRYFSSYLKLKVSCWTKSCTKG